MKKYFRVFNRLSLTFQDFLSSIGFALFCCSSSEAMIYFQSWSTLNDALILCIFSKKRISCLLSYENAKTFTVQVCHTNKHLKWKRKKSLRITEQFWTKTWGPREMIPSKGLLRCESTCRPQIRESWVDFESLLEISA